MQRGLIREFSTKWLGEKMVSSLIGIVSGAIATTALQASTGRISSSELIFAAVGGAASAIIGGRTRIYGEKK